MTATVAWPRSASQQAPFQLTKMLHVPLSLMAESRIQCKNPRVHAVERNSGSNEAHGRASLGFVLFLVS